jgi:hypothetical protein
MKANKSIKEHSNRQSLLFDFASKTYHRWLKRATAIPFYWDYFVKSDDLGILIFDISMQFAQHFSVLIDRCAKMLVCM